MKIDVDSDRFVREVIEQNEYAFLFKDLTVIDLGCNIGTFSFWIYKLAKEIHAIDMVPENIESLNKTIVENNLPNIYPYCIAIAGDTNSRKYTKDPILGGGGSEIRSDGEKTTECTTLRQFMIDNKIEYADVLKMDVEGMEEEILSADFPNEKIGTIVGELHLNGMTVKRREVKGLVEKLGYKYTEYPNNHFIAR